MLLRLLRYPYGNARARALAAGLLSPRQVEELARAASPGQAEAALAERIEGHVGGEAEAAREEEFRAFGAKIARSLPAAPRNLVIAYLGRADVENLKLLCRSLLHGRREEAEALLLPAGPEKFLPRAAREARSLEELVDCLPRSPFRGVLRASLRERPDERLFVAETGLDRAFWQRVAERIGRLPPLDRLAAREILGLRADLDRLRVVSRGADAGVAVETVLAALPPLGTLLPPRRVRHALQSGDPAAALGRLLPAGAPEDPLAPEGEIFLRRRLYRSLRRVLIAPPFDISVPLGALLLKELETRDLNAVLGGLRLGTGREEIAAFLSCRGG